MLPGASSSLKAIRAMCDEVSFIVAFQFRDAFEPQHQRFCRLNARIKLSGRPPGRQRYQALVCTTCRRERSSPKSFVENVPA